MIDKNKSIVGILYKYKQKLDLSSTEEDILYEWISQAESHQHLFDELNNEAYWNKEISQLHMGQQQAAMEVITQRLRDVNYVDSKRNNPWRSYAAAASLVILIASSVFFWNKLQTNTSAPVTAQLTNSGGKDILPAGTRAILELGDGSRVELDKSNQKMVAMQRSGIFISADGGDLEYHAGKNSKVEMHKVLTPRAGQFRVLLPDGSAVWLNAASTLSFPTAFTGNSRVVELCGEGYFEVAKDKSKPFKVLVKGNTGNAGSKGNGFEINVLGTHFNVNAYSDDPSATTTLLEGAVMVRSGSDSARLRPGQQAVTSSNEGLSVSASDLPAAMAWKEKLFWFKDASIPEIMKQLSRWYDVSVVFKGKTEERFTGILPRDIPLSQILELLDKSGKFNLDLKDKTVTVVP